MRENWLVAVVMHNMIVHDSDVDSRCIERFSQTATLRTWPLTFDAFVSDCARVRDITAHRELQQDLIDHLWSITDDDRENDA